MNEENLDRVYVVGNISRDTVWRNDERLGSFWGGAGLNLAAALVMSQVGTVLVSCINENDAPILQATLPACEFEWLLDPEPTCRFEVWYSENWELSNIRCEYGIAGRMNEFVSSLILRPGFYHVCCRNPLDPLPLLTRLIDSRCPFSIDFIASSCDRQIWLARDQISSARCVFVNSTEYETLEKTCDIRKIALLIVTSGEMPVRVFEHGKPVLEMSCQLGAMDSEVSVLDTTGAGDVFAGTFIANHFIHGLDIESSVTLGIINAQKTLQGLGVWDLLT